MDESNITFSHNWYVHVNIYDSDYPNERISFMNAIVETYDDHIPVDSFDDIMYEQVKKPFISNVPPSELGCREGYIFDITNISYIGKSYHEVYYYEDDNQILEEID